VSREGEWIAPEEAGLRLILLLPDGVGATALAGALRTVAAAAVVAHAPAGLGPACAAAGCALLGRDDVDAALAGGADGVLLSAAGRAREARLRLGEGRLLGVEAGHSRHAAILAGEAGADFVTFGATDGSGRLDLDRLSGLVGWWSGISVLPCAAAGPITAGTVPALAAVGADFLAVDAAVWQHPDGAEAALAAIAAAIDRLPPGARGRP
jgi:thiamine-phosphate pyrophosphorylase